MAPSTCLHTPRTVLPPEMLAVALPASRSSSCRTRHGASGGFCPDFPICLLQIESESLRALTGPNTNPVSASVSQVRRHACGNDHLSKASWLAGDRSLNSALSPTLVALSKLASAELQPFPKGRQAPGEGLRGPDRPQLQPALPLWSRLYAKWHHEMQKGCRG